MLKNLKWSSIITSLIVIAAGILLAVFPDVSASVICDVIGIACIVTGVISITTYFMLDLKDSLFRNDFVTGVMIVMLGILVIYQKAVVLKLIPFILGIVILVSGFSKLQDSIDARRIGYKYSWVYIILAAVSIVLGLVIMFSLPSSVTNSILFTVIGCSLIYSGATDLYATIYLSRKINKFMKKVETIAKGAEEEVIDTTAEETPAEQPAEQPEDHSSDTQE